MSINVQTILHFSFYNLVLLLRFSYLLSYNIIILILNIIILIFLKLIDGGNITFFLISNFTGKSE